MPETIEIPPGSDLFRMLSDGSREVEVQFDGGPWDGQAVRFPAGCPVQERYDATSEVPDLNLTMTSGENETPELLGGEARAVEYRLWYRVTWLPDGFQVQTRYRPA